MRAPPRRWLGPTHFVGQLLPRLTPASPVPDRVFALLLAALSPARTVVDGSEQLRGRPSGPILDALRYLWCRARRAGHLRNLPREPHRGFPESWEISSARHRDRQYRPGVLLPLGKETTADREPIFCGWAG